MCTHKDEETLFLQPFKTHTHTHTHTHTQIGEMNWQKTNQIR